MLSSGLICLAQPSGDRVRNAATLKETERISLRCFCCFQLYYIVLFFLRRIERIWIISREAGLHVRVDASALHRGLVQMDGENVRLFWFSPACGAFSGQIGSDISMLGADGWSCLWSNLSSTPASVGRSDISLINHLITAEAQETGMNSKFER